MPYTGVKPITEDPSGYDPKNKFRDPVKYYQHREAVVAEEHVKMAEAAALHTVTALLQQASAQHSLKRVRTHVRLATHAHRLVAPVTAR